jgi:hypothetical protein
LQFGNQIQMTKDFLVGGLSNIPRSSLVMLGLHFSPILRWKLFLQN